jgi:hypothetical protein
MLSSMKKQLPTSAYVVVSLMQKSFGSTIETHRGEGQAGEDEEVDEEDHGGEAVEGELHC